MPRKSLFPSGEKPSLEIKPGDVDVDEILKLAEEVDRKVKMEAAITPEEPKRKRGKPNGKAAEPAPEPVIPADPEFESMINWGVGSAVDVAKEKLDWSEPGVHWRLKVSVIISRIIQRIQPMQPSLLTDLITLSGYTALWVLPNVNAQRKGTDTDTVRDNGKRENVQNAGTLGA